MRATAPTMIRNGKATPAQIPTAITAQRAVSGAASQAWLDPRPSRPSTPLTGPEIGWNANPQNTAIAAPGTIAGRNQITLSPTDTRPLRTDTAVAVARTMTPTATTTANSRVSRTDEKNVGSEKSLR